MPRRASPEAYERARILDEQFGRSLKTFGRIRQTIIAAAVKDLPVFKSLKPSSLLVTISSYASKKGLSRNRRQPAAEEPKTEEGSADNEHNESEIDEGEEGATEALLDIIDSEEEDAHDTDGSSEKEPFLGGLSYYLKELYKFPVLEKEEERDLVDRLQKGDLGAREKFLPHNLRLVVSVAKRYRNRGLDFDDLIQEGALGLMSAAEKFDLSYETKFSTFAVHWIRQSIGLAICNKARTIRIPVHAQDLWSKVSKAIRELKAKQELEYEPTIEEISAHINVPIEEVHKITRRMKTEMDSLDEVVKRDKLSKLGREETLGSLIPDKSILGPEQYVLAKDELRTACQNIRKLLQNLKEILKERDLEVFNTRYGLNDHLEYKTLEEVGEKFNLTRERIRQLVDRAWVMLDNQGPIKNDDSLIRVVKRIHRLENIVSCEARIIEPDVREPETKKVVTKPEIKEAAIEPKEIVSTVAQVEDDPVADAPAAVAKKARNCGRKTVKIPKLHRLAAALERDANRARALLASLNHRYK